MQFIAVTWVLWLFFYFVTIWICVIGRKKNPNKGWNLIITGEIIFIVVHFLFFYYAFLVEKRPIIFLLNISKYFYYTTYSVILPVGMILDLIGLYYIARGKKGTSKKAIKKKEEIRRF